MRTFLGFGQQQYIGIPQAQSIKLAGISAAIVPLLFQWISYGASTASPNVNVLCDLTKKDCTKLDQIRSIYIDNLGSSNPVYVYFPDTGYTAVAKPNSEGWYPAFTNGKIFWVIGEGFLDGSIPQTSVIICNAPIMPGVNTELDNAIALWLASPIITRGTSIYNTSLGIPALGDQLFTSGALGLQISGSTVNNLWGSPYSNGFLYITSMVIYGSGFQPIVGDQFGSFVIESTGVAGILIPLSYVVPSSAFGSSFSVSVGNTEFLRLENLQIKLDANQLWRLRNTNTINSGTCYLISSYTKQP